MYQDVAEYIKEKRDFSDRILKDLRYGTNKFEVLGSLERRLNNELKFPDKKILCADNRKTLKAHIEDSRKSLNKQNPVFSNLLNNNINYVKFDKVFYSFNFKAVSENTSNFDIDSVIEDIVNEIYSQNLITIINELNRILSLERIYPDSTIREFISKFYTGIQQILVKNIFLITLLLIVSLFILIYLRGQINLIFATSSQLTISLAISGLTATFVGFGAVFIQLSFDNYKKYYGSYSKTLLFQSIGREIIIIFFLTNFSQYFAQLPMKSTNAIYLIII